MVEKKEILKDLNNLFDLSKRIDKKSANLQTKTCAQIISMLEESIGVILGDDVGMGKTYVAFATAVYYLKKYPRQKIIIITPSWLLNSKWYKDISDFIEINLNKDNLYLNSSLKRNSEKNHIKEINQYDGYYIKQIAEKSKYSKVLLIPINIFSSKGSREENGFFLSCWLRHKRFRTETKKKIWRAVLNDENIRNPYEFDDIGITYEDIKEQWYKELDKIDVSSKKISEEVSKAISDALKELRYRALNSVIPNSSLLILDEAHKMKSKDTAKRHGLQCVINKKFRKAIFLTATPFQLGELELKSIFDIFKLCKNDKKDIDSFDNKVNSMFLEMQKYKIKVEEFENFVSKFDDADIVLFEQLVKNELDLDDDKLNYDIKETYHLYVDLINQKLNLQGIMKTLIVRNIKNKGEYRKEIIGNFGSNKKEGIHLTEESFLPFALIEKAIHEIYLEGEQTFISNVKQSFTSSFDTVIKSSIYQNDLSSLNVLRPMKIDKIEHPKIKAVTDDVVKALKEGEKTLIFCNRIETVEKLRESIVSNFDRSYKLDKGFKNYYKRFYNKRDINWFLLQENYIQSILAFIVKLCNLDTRVIVKAKLIENDVADFYERYNLNKKINYMYLKRIIEHLVFTKTLEKIENWEIIVENESKELLDTVKNILDKRYIYNGLSIENDIEDIYDDQNMIKDRRISKELIDKIIKYRGIWTRYSSYLNKLEAEEREELVTSMIAFLRRDKEFLIQLQKINEKYPNKDDNFCINKAFKNKRAKAKSSLTWENSFKRFIENYINSPKMTRENMKLGLKRKEKVDKITSKNEEYREEIAAGFNTPFYPQVLIATSIVQEGIDLQMECRRIIHYDLDWNPASIEQRIGRIDRINSLIFKLREVDKNETLNIFYPYIKNTIDENMYNTVKCREKWFNLILGGSPQWDTFDIYTSGRNIPDDIFKKIQIDLSVE